MADAKRCDITGEYFEPDKVPKRRVIVQIVQPRGRPKTPDIGPTLQKKIEALMGISATEPKRPKPAKRRKKKKARKAEESIDPRESFKSQSRSQTGPLEDKTGQREKPEDGVRDEKGR